MGNPAGQPKVALERKRRRSDATFWSDGTVTDHAYWGQWQARMWRAAGWKRALARLAVAVAAGGLWLHRAGTERALAIVCGLVAGYALIRAALWREEREHYRSVIRPTAGALAALPCLIEQSALAPRSWVDVPQDYRTREDAAIVVRVPDDLTGAERDMEDITRAVSVKTGIPSPQVTKKLGGQEPHLAFTRSAPPPPLVTSRDVMPDILAAKRFELILGKGQKGRDGKYPVITTSVKTDTPHTGLGMASQEGKSTAAMNLGTQMAHQGALLIILDYKMLSHMWADGLPNVCYAHTPEMIHEALCWLAWDDRDEYGNIIRPSELTKRKRMGRASGDIYGNVTADLGAPIFIIAEELNATQRQLRSFWRQIGGKGPSPASQALDEVAFTGAALDAYALYIAQRFGARASGSDGSRDAMENIGCFVLKDPPPQTWDLVAAGHAQPPASGHKGRYQKVTRKEVTEFQGVLWTPEDARAFAMSGKVAVPPPGMPFVNHAAPVAAGVGQAALGCQESPERAFDIRPETPSLAPGHGPDRAVTLAQAVAAGLFVSLAAARKAAHRQQWEAVGGDKRAGYLYRITDLYDYKKARGK